MPEGESLEEMLFHLRDHPTAALYSVALLLLGGQLMSMGFLGELFIAYHQHGTQNYSIAERAGRVRREVTSPSDEDPSGDTQ